MKKQRRLINVLSFSIALLFLCLLMPKIAFLSFAASDSSGSQDHTMTWSFDQSSGTLTISGKTYMDNTWNDTPWGKYRDEIKHVALSQDVTEIDDYWFEGCVNLENIELPESITYIGIRAFCGCSKLKDIVIPDSVFYLGEEAFMACTSLEHIGLSHNLTRIREATFERCTSLKTIDIPDSVSVIDRHAFYGCTDLMNVEGSENIVRFGYSSFGNCSNLSTFKIPKKVTVIPASLFSNCEKLTSVSIPNSVTTIEDSAFGGCTSLAAIELPDSITSIGYAAFIGCSSLKSIVFPMGINTLSEAVCEYCRNLEYVVIPKNVAEIGNYAFNNCDNLSALSLPEDIEKIGDYAFSGCFRLASVVLPERLTTLGANAFSWSTTAIKCLSYNCVFSDNSVGKDTTIIGYPGSAVHDYAKTHGIVFIDLNDAAYSGTYEKDEAEIQWTVDMRTGKLEMTGSGVIYDEFTSSEYPWYCMRGIVTEIIFGDGITGIGRRAFEDFAALRNIQFPTSLYRIGSAAFSGCNQLTVVSIPSSVTEIDSGAFSDCCNLSKFIVDPENQFFSNDSDGVLFNKSKTVLVEYPCGRSGGYSVPEGVITIGMYAFSGDFVLKNSKLTSIVLPDSLRTISDQAFDWCVNLNSVHFGCNLEYIGEYAFDGCENLTSVNLPTGLISIGTQAFSDCDALKEIELPEGLQYLGSLAFQNSGVEEIVIPASLHDIDFSFWGDPFENAPNLKRFTVSPENPSYCSDETGSILSKDMRSLLRVPCGIGEYYAIQDYVEEVGKVAFGSCDGIFTLQVPASIRTLQSLPATDQNSDKRDWYYAGSSEQWAALTSEFEWLPAIRTHCNTSSADNHWTEVEVIPSCSYTYQTFTCSCGFELQTDVIYFGNHEKELETVTKEPTCTSGGEATYSCTRCGKVITDYLPSLGHEYKGGTCVRCGKNRYNGIISKDVHWTYEADSRTLTVDGIGQMTYIDWGNNDYEYWENSRNIRNVVIEEGIQTVRESAFSNCICLKDVMIPTSVMSIGRCAFFQCSSLRSVTIPASVKEIGEYAFGYEQTDYSNEPIPGFTICGYRGTAAQTYAIANGFTFIILEDPCINGHDFGEWLQSKEASCTTAGLETRRCNRCNEEQSRTLAPLGHNYYAGACTRCGEQDPDYVPEEPTPVDQTPVDPTPVEPTPAVRFSDVPEGAFYAKAVAWAVSQNPAVTKGTGDGKFSPSDTCTRGQVVTFLWRAMGCPEPKTTANPFTDVKQGAFYYKAVLWAVENGITSGTGEGRFSPEEGCTRAQVVTFLWRAEGKPGANNPASFSDVAQGAFYARAVAWAVEQGITKGTGDGKFEPNQTCTRGQVVTFLYRDLA